MTDDLQPPSIHKAAEELSKLGVEINNAHTLGELVARKSLVHFAAAGKMLAKAKERCGHGKFGAWLKKHIKFTDRTARAYMALAKSEAASDLTDQLRILTDDPEASEGDAEEGVTKTPKAPSKPKPKTAKPKSKDEAKDETEDEDKPDSTPEFAPETEVPHPDEPAKIVVETITTELCLTAITTIIKESRRVKDALSQIMSSPFGVDLRKFLCEMRGQPIDRCELYQTGGEIKGGSWGIVSFAVREYTTNDFEKFLALVGVLKDWFRRADSKLIERPEDDDEDPAELGAETRGDDDGAIAF